MGKDRSRPSAIILEILLKDMEIKPTVTSISEEIGMSRVGTWKTLKKMQSERLIALSPVGTGKTSIHTARINWDNPLAEKKLALSLTEDALKNERWRNNFLELEKKVDFLILYGSIIRFPKEANDLDILAIVSEKSEFLEIEKSVRKIQKTQLKKIHLLSFTPDEFSHELLKPNKAFVDAIKTGVVLFGQEKFIKFMKTLYKK